jgi:hypothetical protein
MKAATGSSMKASRCQLAPPSSASTAAGRGVRAGACTCASACPLP